MKTTTDIHPIFQACCSEVNDRYGGKSPHIAMEWMYVTNGQIIVRQETTDRDTLGFAPPNVEALFVGGEFDDKPTPIPDVDYPAEKVVCPDCDGIQGLEQECKTCDGYCEGDGLVWPIPKVIEVAPDYGLSNRYLALLLKHGAKLYLPVALGSKAAKFTVGPDIEGRVMPMGLL